MAKFVGGIEMAVTVLDKITNLSTDLAAAYAQGGWKGVAVEGAKKAAGVFTTDGKIKPVGGGGEVDVEALAEGGPVAASTPYIVGEVGPELFVPNTAGTVIPNNQLASNGGSTDVTALANAIVAAFQSGVKLQVTTDPTFSGGGMNQGRYSS